MTAIFSLARRQFISEVSCGSTLFLEGIEFAVHDTILPIVVYLSAFDVVLIELSLQILAELVIHMLLLSALVLHIGVDLAEEGFPLELAFSFNIKIA